MRTLTLAWESFKDWLSATTGLTHHDLHLLLGVLLTLGIGRALRRPIGSWLPLLIVLLLELVNEVFDFTRYYLDSWPWTPYETVVDILITVVPPLLIVLAARWDSPAFHHFRRRAPFTISVRTLDDR